MSMETLMNGFLWTLLTSQKTKKLSNKKLKNNIIKNKIERANTELNRESDSTKPQSQTRMFSRRKKTFLSFTLSLFYLFVAPVMQVLPVYAAEPAAALSVWDFMITELVGANCIITDSAVLSAYGSALGSLNAATATAAEIDAAIATAAVNCGVDLAPVFANTAASAATVGVEAAAATAGENLATTCSGFYAAGEGSAVIPAIGQVLMDAAGVAGIVAGIAYIGKMVAETMGDVIKFGQDVKNLSTLASLDMSTATGGGTTLATRKYNADNVSSSYQDYAYLGSPIGYVRNGNIVDIYALNTTPHSYIPNIRNILYGNSWTTGNTCAAYSYVNIGSTRPSSRYTFTGALEFSSTSAISAYVNKFSTGEYQPVFPSTPSIASSQGYQKYNPDYVPSNPETGVPGFPEIQPLPDYANGYGLEPINPPSYQALVDAILEVPGNPSYLEEQLSNDNSIAEIVQPLISPHIVPLPNPGTNPDPQPTGTPDPQPTGSPNPNPNPNPKPNTQPFPDPENVPQVTPVVNPTPDSDVVPAPVPYPDPETPTEQDKTDTDTKITPIDLRDKFPFCIPFDMLKIMKLFQGGREAPCFTWDIPFGIAGQSSVTIDLAPWDSVATIMRTMELILFIMLLAVGTRNLLGGSS